MIVSDAGGWWLLITVERTDQKATDVFFSCDFGPAWSYEPNEV